MRIPKTLKIGGHTVRIELKEKLDDDNDGFWNSRTNTIQLNKALPPSQMQATLLHEIIHSINIQMNHNDVEFLSQALFQTISDNKLYFDGKGVRTK